MFFQPVLSGVFGKGVRLCHLQVVHDNYNSCTTVVRRVKLIFFVDKQCSIVSLSLSQTPLGQINLRDARIEEVDRSCETDSDSDVASQTADYTLAIWPANDGPTYLLIPVKQKKVFEFGLALITSNVRYYLNILSGNLCCRYVEVFQFFLSQVT